MEAHDEMREVVLGDGLRVTILTTAAETEGRHDLTDGTLPPGAATPLHVHTLYDERFYVIEGSLTIHAGNETVTLGPGGFHAVRAGTPHMVQAGPEGGRSLCISSPAAFAELVARTGTPAGTPDPESAFDPDHFTAVSTSLGDVVLGPPGTKPWDLPGG